MSESSKSSDHKNEAVHKSEDQIQKLMEENRKLRRVLQLHHRSLMQSPLRCTLCPKSFVDPKFLEAHMQKRHPASGLDAPGIAPLTAKITDYNNQVGRDKQMFEKMVAEISDKLAQTEAALESERNARSELQSKLEQEMNNKLRDLENALIEQFNSRILTREVTVAAPQQPEQHYDSASFSRMDDVLTKHTSEVIKLGKGIEALANKLDNVSPVLSSMQFQQPVAPFTPTLASKVDVRSESQYKVFSIPNTVRMDVMEQEPVKNEWQTPQRTEVEVKVRHKRNTPIVDRNDTPAQSSDPVVKVEDMISSELSALQILPEMEGIDEAMLQQAIRRLEERRDSDPASQTVRQKIVQILEEMTADFRDLNEETGKKDANTKQDLDPVPVTPDEQSAPEKEKSGKPVKSSRKIAGAVIRKRTPGILKSHSQSEIYGLSNDSEDKKGRRISFCDERIEISPSDSSSSSSSSISDVNELVPTPRPRTSTVKQKVSVEMHNSDKMIEDELDLSRVDMSPEKKPLTNVFTKITAI